MRPFLYRFYTWLLISYANLGQRFFQMRLKKRKDQLAQADLSYLNLSGTDLSHADLRDTNLSYTDLTGVNLSQADLSRANLRGAKVTPEQLQQARSLEGATLPNGEKRYILN
ncbi:MAG: pentapeptide repeat-containing protein [Chloroflexota bacterium]